MSQTRSAIRAACFGRLGVVAAAIFGASLDHLQETPRLYGAVATALLLANLIAAIPARAAGRTHGADILRTE